MKIQGVNHWNRSDFSIHTKTKPEEKIILSGMKKRLVYLFRKRDIKVIEKVYYRWENLKIMWKVYLKIKMN